MKNALFTILLGLLILSIPSCKLDLGGGIGPNPKGAPIELEGRISDEMTLEDHNDDGVDYIIVDDVEIVNSMVIEPGVTIQVNETNSFKVWGDGKLVAEGTATEPIRFVGELNEPCWSGILIESDFNNKLKHVIIENAGEGSSLIGFSDIEAALNVNGKVSIEECTITQSGDRGVYFGYENNVDLVSFTGNTIKECKSYPMETKLNYLENMDLTSCVFKDNDENYVHISPEYGDRLLGDLTLEELTVPYLISGRLDLYADLTLEAGVEIVMDDNSEIAVSSSVDPALKIEGTDSKHVVIKGREAEQGYWKGIYVKTPNNSNVWEYLDISDGGGEKMTFRDGKSNVSLEWNCYLKMENCTSTRCGDCEVFISQFSGDPELVNESPAITNVCEQ